MNGAWRRLCYPAAMRALILVGGLALLALFLGLDRVDFIDHREARDAVVAREIVSAREILTPRLGGQPWFEKPLLGYGLEVAGARLTPGTPLGSRVLRAGAAVLLALLVGAIGVRHFGKRAGACAAVVFATSLALPVAARSDGAQVLAAGVTWLAIGLWLEALTRGPSAGRLLAAYGSLAIVMLIAGPLPALWPFAAMALTLRRAGLWALWSRLQPVAGLSLIVGIVLPWYGAMLQREGPGFLVRALAFPYGTPATTPWYTAPAQVLGYLFVGLYPWSTVLAAAVLRTTGRGETTAPRSPASAVVPERFLIGALVVSLVTLLIAPGAPLSSILAALPAMALLVGPLIDRALAGEVLWQRALGQAAIVLAVTGTVAGWLMSSQSRRLGVGDAEIRLLSSVLFVASWAPLLATFVRRPRAVPALLALLVTVGNVLVSWRTLPALTDLVTTRAVSESMAQVAPADAALLLLEPPPPSLRLRAERPLVVTGDLRADLRAFRARDGHTYVAFRQERQSEVARSASPAALEILARTPALCLARIAD